MKAREAEARGPVWVTRGKSTRPAIIVHTESGRPLKVWVSYTDGLHPVQAKVTPAQLEKRGSR